MRAKLDLALLAVSWLVAPSAFAKTGIISQSAVYDPSTADVDFTIVFNHTVDFTYQFPSGRQTDGFQYAIVGDGSQDVPLNYDSIIRGDEIFDSGGKLRIRYAYPQIYDDDPTSAGDYPNYAGGWGPTRALVPYTLVDGNVLSFTVPLSDISEHSLDGTFQYDFTTDNINSQTTTDSFTAESTIKPGAVVTPEPSSLVLLGSGLLGSVGVLRRRVSRRR